MVRRQILRARSLWLRLLHLGSPPRAADGGAQELHRVQGPHAQAPRRHARGGEREGQGLIGIRPRVRYVSCFTLRRADASYRGDVTERSVMAVGLLPPPLLGVSSLDLAPLASASGAFFHARGSNRAAIFAKKKRAGRSRRATWQWRTRASVAKTGGVGH